jgi:hypothetical protein
MREEAARFFYNRHGLLSSQGSTRRLAEQGSLTRAAVSTSSPCDGAVFKLTNSGIASKEEQEDALTAKNASDPCSSRTDAVWSPSLLPRAPAICNYAEWWSEVVEKTDNRNGAYDLCYASKASAEEAEEELEFKKNFLQFHFLTTAPYPRFGVYNRMQFRFPVPLLNSEYSLQSHCFRSLEWPPTGETGDACVPQKTGSLGAGDGSCILGVCGPNGVNYLPEAYLTAYKHLTLELCHNNAPPSLKIPPSVQSCQPTVITSLDAKGKISQRWSIKVHQSMVDAWANGTANGTIEKGCYTCNTVPDLPSNRVPACRDYKRVLACAIGTGRSKHFRMPFVRCFEAKGLSPGHGQVR